MLSLFGTLKIYLIIGVFALGAFAYMQKQQISTQKFLITELKASEEEYKNTLKGIEEEREEIKAAYVLLEKHHKSIQNEYSNYTKGLNEEFKNYQWDEEVMPVDLYCRVKCLYGEQSARCACEKYSNATDVHRLVRNTNP